MKAKLLLIYVISLKAKNLHCNGFVFKLKAQNIELNFQILNTNIII
jgi:hypothetical protein